MVDNFVSEASKEHEGDAGLDRWLFDMMDWRICEAGLCALNFIS